MNGYLAAKIRRIRNELMLHGHAYHWAQKPVPDGQTEHDAAKYPRRPLVLGVRTPPAGSAADTAAWVASSVIGGRAKIVSLRDRRVLGIRRAPVEGDSDLVPSRGVSLYSIAADPELVAPGEEMVIVNPDPSARSPQEIVLYVRNRE